MTPDTPQESGPGRREIQAILERYQRLGAQRIERVQASLTREQRHFLQLLPLLLHTNHPSLPGYAGNEAPAGIADFNADRETELLARRYARGLRIDPRLRNPPLLALYLIGSLGTLGHHNDSDFDFWLCHRADLNERQLAALREKTDRLTAHGAGLGLEMTFFPMVAEDFRDGRNNALSNESSGHLQHHLLLEEFYRSGLLLAGLPPLWWLVPPQHADDYSDYCKRLIEQRFVNPNHWLDFGGLQEISRSEFLSAAFWLLYKSIVRPYKALLKLMVHESYASEYPHIHWLCDDAKDLIHARREPGVDEIDSYRLLLKRIERHLADAPERLDLARRAFYIKSGARLSEPQGNHWKRALMEQLAEDWGWRRGELLNLDTHSQWKLEQVVRERNRLVAELAISYRQLSALASDADTQATEETRRDLALLGRKLYAALERRPGKVDNVNPGISDDISADTVWLRRDENSETWHLYLQSPLSGAPKVRSASNLVELLAWLQRNGVVARHTRVDLPPEQCGPAADEHLRIMGHLQKRLPPETQREVPLRDFAKPARGRLSLAFVNALHPVECGQSPGMRVSDRGDPLSFGTLRCNLAQRIDHLHSNSWGELVVDHYRGETGLLDLLCAHLEDFTRFEQGGKLECYCHTPGYGHALETRLAHLADQLLRHFRGQGETSRFLLCVGEHYHLIECKRGNFTHSKIGAQRDLMTFLGEAGERFRATGLDVGALPQSPLAHILAHNESGQVQLFYTQVRDGVAMWLLDRDGALFEHFEGRTGEQHFLIRQVRFFATLDAWNSPWDMQSEATRVDYLRLQKIDTGWRSEPVHPPAAVAPGHTELLLSTGRRGPWKDGFSLISGAREFSSQNLGDALYHEVVTYLLSLRSGGEDYPIYLTGVVADQGHPNPLPLVELLGFKQRIERQLARAVQQLRTSSTIQGKVG